MVELLRPIMPGLTDIRADDGIVYTLTESEAVPVVLMGDGQKRMFTLVAHLSRAEDGGLALLEEPDRSLHPSAMRLLAETIWAAVDAGTQVVISTHSHPLARMLEGMSEASDDDPNESRAGKLSILLLGLESGRLSCEEKTSDSLMWSYS